MTYTMKPLGCDPKGIKGMSEKLIVSHYENNYGGAVKRLKAEGDRFTVSFDGKQLYTAQDTTFANPGKVALWTKADSVTHFDKITITSLP